MAAPAGPACGATRCRSPASWPSCWSWPRSHVVVARYDAFAMDLVDRGCDGIFIGEDTAQDCPDEASADRLPSAAGSDEPTEEPTDSPTPEPTLIGTPVPNVSIAPWDGKERLNILLIGADEQGGGHNTDTLITVSIDPVTKQVAMFSLPRDTVDVPIPQGPARQVWGRGLLRQDQQLLRQQPSPLGPVVRQRPDARLQRA